MLGGIVETVSQNTEETVQLHSLLFVHASLQDQVFWPLPESCLPISQPVPHNIFNIVNILSLFIVDFDESPCY